MRIDNGKWLVSKKKGFTLIELLVVIMIIAFLAAAGMVSYRQANIKSRDAKRQSDLEQVRVALELYRADNPGYPSPVNGYGGSPGLAAKLVPTYMNALPNDPKQGWTYRWNGLGTCFESPSGSGVFYCPSYELCAEMEGSNPGSCGNTGTDFCSGAGSGGANCNYGAKSP